MTQMHELCLLGYELAILDTAFLVHRPGIKELPSPADKVKSQLWRQRYVNQNDAIYAVIMTEMKSHYGANKKCREHS